MNGPSRYFICSPEPYTHSIGGIVVLFELAKRINLLNEKAIILTPKLNQSIGIPQIECKWNKTNSCKIDISENDIVLYPEVIEGNPLNAKNVVRWLLHSPEFFGTKWNPNPEDLIFHYSHRGLYDSHRKPISGLNTQGLLHVTKPNLSTFYHRRGFRWRISCMVRKSNRYGTRKILPKIGLPIIDNLGLEDQAVLAKHFHQSLVFISYDSESFHSIQAALCGALSIIVPNKTVSRKEHYKQPNFKYGVAYGILGIPWAIATRHKVHGYFTQMQEEENRTVRSFILTTQQAFHNKPSTK